MIAILYWVDGFGYDTCVRSIHETLGDAKKKHAEDIKKHPETKLDRWVEFEFGDVDFDYGFRSNSFDE